MADNKIIKDQYELLQQLQVGPLSTTHMARDTKTGDRVVLKELAVSAGSMEYDASDALKRLELLEREGKILRNLDHPGIPRFIETFRSEDPNRVSLWLVQEYRPGKNLRQKIEDGWHGSAEDITDLLRQVCSILQYLHSRIPPIVHRDIKPANIVIGEDGTVSLVDLGAACTRVLTREVGSTVIGTPGYVPIEQFAGQATPASDVYALGMVGIFMVTHEEPLKLVSEEGLVQYRHLTSVNHPTLLKTIDHMVEPLLPHRLPTVQSVLDSLDGINQPTKRKKRSVWPWLTPVTTLFALLLGFAGATFWFSDDPAYREHQDQATSMPAVDDNEYQPQLGGLIGNLVGSDGLDGMGIVAATDNTPEEQSSSCTLSYQEETTKKLNCTIYDGSVSPFIVAPGRVRSILWERPDNEDQDDEAKRELEDYLDERSPFWVVDFDHMGHNIVGESYCPGDGTPIAATQLSSGLLHVLCSEEEQMQIYHIVADLKRKTNKVKGPYVMSEDEMYYEDWAMSPILAVPERGPALLIQNRYQMDYEMEAETEQPWVQPLARGARDFELFPSTRFAEVGDWQVITDGRHTFALVHTRLRQDTEPKLYKVRLTSTGARAAEPLELEQTADREPFCHRLNTALTADGIVVRAPSADGDKQAWSVLKTGQALPTSQVSPRDIDLCYEADQVFVRNGGAKASFVLQEDMGYPLEYVFTCKKSNCMLAFFNQQGVEVVRFTLGN